MPRAMRRRLTWIGLITVVLAAFAISTSTRQRDAEPAERVSNASIHTLARTSQPVKLPPAVEPDGRTPPVVIGRDVRELFDDLRQQARQDEALGWSHQPLTAAGVLRRERWCQPPTSAEECAELKPAISPAVDLTELALVVDDPGATQARGFIYRAVRSDPSRQARVDIVYNSGDPDIIGNGLVVVFSLADRDQWREVLRLGARDRVRFQRISCWSHRAGGPGADDPAAELEHLGRTPRSFALRVRERLNALEEVVEHSLTTRDLDSSPKESRQGCRLPQQDPEARAEALIELRQTLDRRRDLLDIHADRFHFLLHEALLDRLL